MALTELNAVNRMLRIINEMPVSSISGTISLDSIAQTVLLEVSEEVQTEGLQSNTDVDYPLTPDASNNINIPAAVLKIDAMDADVSVAVRGSLLYDKKNRTLEFTQTELKCKIVWLLDFEDLPNVTRTYITLRAARRFAAEQLGVIDSVAITEADEMRARAAMVRHEHFVGQHSMLQSVSIDNIVNRRHNPNQ